MLKAAPLVILATVLSLESVQAQGTITYLSNLGQSSIGNLAVGSDSWLASGFTTGSNAGGYDLDSVQLAMANASANPSGFSVILYSAGGVAGPDPGSSLGTLGGSGSPATAGIYTFTAPANLMLSPDTTYFMVLTSETTIANGAYEWSSTSLISYNPSGGWGGQVVFGSQVMVHRGGIVQALLNLPSMQWRFPSRM